MCGQQRIWRPGVIMAYYRPMKKSISREKPQPVQQQQQ
jgi:hypothetical protein